MAAQARRRRATVGGGSGVGWRRRKGEDVIDGWNEGGWWSGVGRGGGGERGKM